MIAAGEPQEDLGRYVLGGQSAMGAVVSDELGMAGLERSEAFALELRFQAPPENLREELRFLAGVGAGDDERSRRLEAILESRRDLEEIRGRTTGSAPDADAVLAVALERHGGEVGDGVGGDVDLRMSHLVQELLADRLEAHQPPGARVLGQDEGSVGLELQDGESDVDVARHFLPVGEVSSRRLGSALDEMGGDDSLGEPIVVVGLPAELVDQRG